jgi:hypothetical protein
MLDTHIMERAFIDGQEWIHAPLDNDWLAWFRLESQDGFPVIAEVRVVPRDDSKTGTESEALNATKVSAPPGGITTRHLRALRPGEVMEFISRTAQIAGMLSKMELPEELSHLKAFADSMRARYHRAARTKRKRERKPDAFFAELAQAYTSRLAAQSRRPVADLSEKFNMPAPRLRDAIHEARKRGLLAPVQQGRPGGMLTKKAVAVLQKKGKKDGRQRQTAKKRR